MNSLLGGGGGQGPRNPYRGFWQTPGETAIPSMSDPFQQRINTMWGRWAPEGTAMPGTFGDWRTAMQGYMPSWSGGGGGPAGGAGGSGGVNGAPMAGGGGGGGYRIGGGWLDNLGGGRRGSGGAGAPGAGNGIGGGTPPGGGGTGGGGTTPPASFSWAFPQYSQTWASPLASLPTPAPVMAPPVFKKTAYTSDKEKDKKRK